MAIKYLKDADSALAEIARIDAQVGEIEHEMNETVAEAKLTALDKAAPLQKRKVALEEALQTYAESEREEGRLEDVRSVQTPHGVFGFRASTELKTRVKITWEKCLTLIKEAGWGAEAVRVREAVDKETLRKWPPARLAQVGLRLVPKDNFFLRGA